MKLPKIEIKTWSILKFSDIPEEMADCPQLCEVSNDVYIEHEVTSKIEQERFDDDFTLDNWIIENYPELEGQTILIHMDY